MPKQESTQGDVANGEKDNEGNEAFDDEEQLHLLL